MAILEKDTGTTIIALALVALSAIPIAGLTFAQAVGMWLLLSLYGLIVIKLLLPEKVFASVLIAMILFGFTGLVFGIVPGGVFAALSVAINIPQIITLVVIAWLAIMVTNWAINNVEFVGNIVEA